MRLYHHPFSSNARRVVMTAHHLGLFDSPRAGEKIELTVVDLAKGEQRKPEFLALNPNGRVPVLVDGDFVLTESHAMMQYLADKTPGHTLYPQERRARADVNRWLFWNAHHFAPSVTILGWEHIVKRMIGLGEPDPAQVKRGQELVLQFATVLDRHLTGKTWLAQEQLTLADLAVATPLMIRAPAQLPVSDLPNLLAWFDRVQALDAWKKTSL